MSKSALYTLILALLTLIGGSAGYLIKGSLPSLVASSITGFALFLCLIAILRGHDWGHFIALGIGSLLTCFFAFRFGINPSMIPLIMALVSALYSYLMIKPLVTENKQK